MIHARNFADRRVAKARLVDLVEPVAEARQNACRELQLDTAYAEHAQALADPRVDAVLVATATTFHRAIVVAAAQAGKHILCEKPMATNARECDEMIAAAEAAQVKLQIGFMRRFDAGSVAAKQHVNAGEIGQVVLVKSLTHGPTTPKPWMYDIRTSLGPLAEVNSHDIDSFRWFTGSEFEEVYALGGNYRSPAAHQRYPDFYDNVILTAQDAQRHAGLDQRAGIKYGYDAALRNPGRKGPDHRRRSGCQFGGQSHPRAARRQPLCKAG